MVYILSLQNLVLNSTGGTNSSTSGGLPTNEEEWDSENAKQVIIL
jgi:hypothetical protein